MFLYIYPELGASNNKQAKEELDEEKFVSEFSRAVIKNWKGLTLAHLETLLLVDIEGKDADSELEYNEDNAESIIMNHLHSVKSLKKFFETKNYLLK